METTEKQQELKEKLDKSNLCRIASQNTQHLQNREAPTTLSGGRHSQGAPNTVASRCISHRHPHLHYTQHFSLYWPAAEEPPRQAPPLPPSSVSPSLCYVQAELAASLRLSASLSCESRPLNSLKRRCRPNKHRRIGFPSERGCTLSFRGLAGRRAVAFYFIFCTSPKAKCAATVHGYHLDKPTRGGWKGRRGGKESSKRENSGACKGPQMKRPEGPIGEELRHSTAGL